MAQGVPATVPAVAAFDAQIARHADAVGEQRGCTGGEAGCADDQCVAEAGVGGGTGRHGEIQVVVRVVQAHVGVGHDVNATTFGPRRALRAAFHHPVAAAAEHRAGSRRTAGAGSTVVSLFVRPVGKAR